MWIAVFIMWIGNTQSVFAPDHIFFTKNDCEEFRVIQHTSLERTKPHEQSGVKASQCVFIQKSSDI
mgnify:FL=1